MPYKHCRACAVAGTTWLDRLLWNPLTNEQRAIFVSSKVRRHGTTRESDISPIFTLSSHGEILLSSLLVPTAPDGQQTHAKGACSSCELLEKSDKVGQHPGELHTRVNSIM